MAYYIMHYEFRFIETSHSDQALEVFTIDKKKQCLICQDIWPNLIKSIQ